MRVQRLMAWSAAAVLAACSAPYTATSSHSIKGIVSLIPSLTEDLCAIGAGRALVGVDAYSSQLRCAKRVPVVADAVSIDAERIIALHPGAVVGIPAQDALTAPLRRARIATHAYRDDSFADIFEDLTALGALSGHASEAHRLIAKLRRETARLRVRHPSARTPRVFVALGTGPIWTVGPSSYIATLLRYAGARDAAALRSAYGMYSAEALVQAQPDAIVADPAIHLDRVLMREPWRSLDAVRAHRLFVMAAPDELMRPGPRYNEGLRWLIERLRPLTKAH